MLQDSSKMVLTINDDQIIWPGGSRLECYLVSVPSPESVRDIIFGWLKTTLLWSVFTMKIGPLTFVMFREKPSGVMIPTHLKVLTIVERPFIYIKNMTFGVNCDDDQGKRWVRCHFLPGIDQLQLSLFSLSLTLETRFPDQL